MIDDSDIKDLFTAINAHNSDKVCELLDKHPEYINNINEQGLTPIMEAIIGEYLEIIYNILRYKPNLTLKDKFGRDARFYATNKLADSELGKTILYLLDISAEGQINELDDAFINGLKKKDEIKNAERQGNYLSHMLLEAIHKDDLRTAEDCLQKLTKVDSSVNKPVWLVLAKFGRCGWVEVFLKYISIKEVDIEENTPLHVAAKHDQLEFYKIMINTGLTVTLNKLNYIPAHYAALSVSGSKVFEYLLKNHESGGKRPIILPHFLIQFDRKEQFQMMLDYYRWPIEQFISIKDVDNLDALEFASKSNKIPFIDCIFNYYQQRESRIYLLNNNKAIHLAASSNCHETVIFLLKLKANPLLQDEKGNTPKTYTSNRYIIDLLENISLKTKDHDKVKVGSYRDASSKFRQDYDDDDSNGTNNDIKIENLVKEVAINPVLNPICIDDTKKTFIPSFVSTRSIVKLTRSGDRAPTTTTTIELENEYRMEGDVVREDSAGVDITSGGGAVASYTL